MNIALVGTGQMGTAVREAAPDHGHQVGLTFDSATPFADAPSGEVASADAAIDFSLPSLALKHIQRYCELGLPAVIGTTGWSDERDTVKRWVKEHEAHLLYAPNFSVGVAVLRTALEAVGPLLDEFDEYDAFVQETHHTNKVDSPSGTAKMLGDVLVEALDRKDHLETETQHQRIDPAAVHVTSSRAGTIYGEHAVRLDSPYDQIRLGHRAKSRRGFAEGALRSAEWLVEQPPGLYRMDDMLADWLDDAR